MGSQLEKVVLLCIFSPDSGYPQGPRRQFRGNTTLHQALPLVKGRESTKLPRQKIFSRAEISEPAITSGRSPGESPGDLLEMRAPW